MTRCPYPHRLIGTRKPKSERLKFKQKTKQSNSVETAAENIPIDKEKVNTKRYFVDESTEIAKQNCEMNSESENQNSSPSNEKSEQIIVVRKPIIGSLPAFIPIG